MKKMMILDVKNNYRTDVQEPVNNRMTIRLVDLSVPGVARPDLKYAEADVTVVQALDLIERLSKAVQEFCQRGDIHQALLSTDSGAMRS